MLESRPDAIRCLVTYTDWWQPPTSSVMKVGGARLDKNIGDGLNPGILETLEERTELNRRVRRLADADRLLLFLFYVRQLHVDDIADAVGISRRQCYRRRNSALQRIVEVREPQSA